MSAKSPGNGPRFGRRRSLLHALVEMPRRHAMRCLVQEINQSEAIIEFPSAVSLPARFSLRWEEIGVSAECEVRYTEGARVTVGFISDQSQMIARHLGADPAKISSEARDIAAQPPRRDTDLRRKNIGGDPVNKVRLRRAEPGKSEPR